ncbi:MAG TPA: sugar transferase [Candidatus Angelobacter sp.]|nr:sugar transferase [Candidatus Angelobacter sp.]
MTSPGGGTHASQLEPKIRRVVSSYCNSAGKRAWDLSWAIVLLVLFSPLMLLLALAVKLTSKGPVLFRQSRPGRSGREFSILKFRTMIVNGHETGPVLTRALDPRVTWLGRHMRKWKLDELPQLFNVVRGEMSFVGPRPQPTRLWNDPAIHDDASLVLSVRPGLTSHATLVFRNEEDVLAPLSSDEVEEVYQRTLMPLKLKLEIQYLCKASFWGDLWIILRTIGRVFNRHEERDDVLKEYLPASNGSPAKPGEHGWAPPNVPSWPVVPELKDVRTVANTNVSAKEQ